ncbi:MAG: hypothetical protein PT120_07030 [Aphanizomenon gracile PMC649.10]|jgi:hypothetical protein|nr:hypothetical protein [Aphanizomenon gracile PMC638.10]MDM3850410.1 hypothetical protein [Aphanizomenon gracile PMC627.10]MDM3854658.1 hypothetical protein [Aphanizomenon gracile PMC649.10]MDM3860810.1 hypothetical protein [Aphanizomenon gracile PMC644.10]
MVIKFSCVTAYPGWQDEQDENVIARQEARVKNFSAIVKEM